ncbi:hypothetical protein DICVIV_12779, partial [Dictyocaulus viviparus]
MTNNPYITATEHNLALRVVNATIPRNQNHLNCKGRLGKADIPFNTQQPILIANNTKLAKIIIHDNHLPYHCGTGQTMANVTIGDDKEKLIEKLGGEHIKCDTKLSTEDEEHN